MRSIVRCGRGGVQLSQIAPVLHRFDLSLTRPVQLHINPIEYCRQIIVDFGIPESDNTISLLLKPKLPFSIAFRGFGFIMMAAVEFDDQTGSRSEEVDDIGTDRGLAPEMCAICRKFFQRAPQYALVWCRVGSESFGCRPANAC
jgi:hypothetical protein